MVMSKKLAVMMAAVLAASLFTACGGSEETKSASVQKEEAQSTEKSSEVSSEQSAAEVTEAPEETEVPEATEAPEETAADDGQIGAELPEITGSISKMELTVNGVEMSTYWDEPVVRFYMAATNTSEYPLQPRGFEGYTVLAYQNGEELDTCISDGAGEAEYNCMKNFYPGTSAEIDYAYQLANDTDPVTLKLVWDDGEMEYVFDITDVCGAPAEPVEPVPVTDTSWFQPASSEMELFGISYTVSGVEVVDGYPEYEGGYDKVLRVTYTAVNNGEDSSYLAEPFDLYQDGIQIESGAIANEQSDTELIGAVEIQPGETAVYTCDYNLRSMDPVFFVELNVGGLNGLFMTLE